MNCFTFVIITKATFPSKVAFYKEGEAKVISGIMFSKCSELSRAIKMHVDEHRMRRLSFCPPSFTDEGFVA